MGKQESWGKRLVAALMSIVLVVGLAPVVAFADDAAIAQGEIGNCTWVIDGAGQLTVRPTMGLVAELDYTSGDPKPPWYEYRTSIKSAKFEGTVAPRVVFGMFEGCSNLSSVDFSGLDITKSNSAEQMFADCSSLEMVDLSGLDFTGITMLDEMFRSCSSLKSVKLPSDLSGAARISQMFRGCSSLQSIDLSAFRNAKITDASSLFSGCSSLKSVDLSVLAGSRIERIDSMFGECSSLESVNLQGFDTSQATGMSFLFGGCSSLRSIDVSGFNTANVTNMMFMFGDCSALTSLDLSSFDTSKVTQMLGMLRRANSLTTLTVGAKFIVPTDGVQSQIDIRSGWWKAASDGEVYSQTLPFGKADTYTYQAGRTIPIPNPTQTEFTFNGAGHTVLSNYNTEDHYVGYTVTGGSEENAGEYVAVATLGDPNNFTWDDGTVTDKEVHWTIKRANATVRAYDETKVQGDPDPDFYARVDDMTEMYVIPELTYTVTREPGEAVGTYAITPVGEAVQGNFNVTYVPAVLTITPKEQEAVHSDSGSSAGSNADSKTPKVMPTIKLAKSSKTVTVKAAKKKAQVLSIGAKSNSGGKLSYKLVKKSAKVTFKNGKATLKKGTKKGTYSIKVKVSVAKKGKYAAGSKTFVVTFKVK